MDCQTAKKVRCVLVGIGGFASSHINHLLNTADGDRVELVGLVDPYPNGCKRLDELLARGAKLYADIRDFYRENTADLAVICTPIEFHADHIITALENGSHVMCEKPLCGDARDIDRILAAQRKANRTVAVGYQWSHSNAIQSLKQDIMDGVFGKALELKTLILWPRKDSYFGRGTGWAGRIKSPRGALVYDSVANNAAAHYLHNMFFLLGESMERSAAPIATEAELLRANPIENFDTAHITCTMADGATLRFVASHTIKNILNPIFDYRFEKGRILCAQQAPDPALGISGEYVSRQIVAYLDDGTVKTYGDPFSGGNRKLTLMLDVAQGLEPSGAICGIETAAVHTRMINAMQENSVIHDVLPARLRRHEDLTYVEGLEKALIDIYEKGDGSISEFYAQ